MNKTGKYDHNLINAYRGDFENTLKKGSISHSREFSELTYHRGDVTFRATCRWYTYRVIEFSMFAGGFLTVCPLIGSDYDAAYNAIMALPNRALQGA